MKNFFVTLVVIAQIAAAIWLAAVESWVSGVMFFVVSAVIIGLLLTFHDAVSGLFRPHR